MPSIHRTALLAAVIALPAMADIYTITGKQTEFGFNPKPPVTPTVTNTPAEPTFHGTWQVDTGSGVSGVIAFDDYHAKIKAMLFKAEVAHSGTLYRIDGGKAIATNEGGENGNAIHTWTFTGERKAQ